MTDSKLEIFQQAALRRIYWFMAAFGGMGTVLAALVWNGRDGVGFAFGATVAILNFRWFHQLVEALGPGAARPRKRLVFWIVLRYPLLAAAGYVMLINLEIRLLAPACGLLVAAAAVLAEILYELFYART